MKSPITKLAAAAVMIIAVIVGIIHFVGSIGGTSVVWAEVIKNIEQVSSATWREKRVVTCDGNEVLLLNSDAARYYSSEYGGREDMHNTQEGWLLHQVYWLQEDNVCVKVLPLLKRYKRTELTDAERVGWGQKSVKAAVGLVKSEEPRRLGRKRISGREAEGFEIVDSIMATALVPVKVDHMVARFWIDVETLLPICYEAEVLTSDRYVTFLTDGKPVEAKVTAGEFQWNVELDASEFEPNIPADYTLLEE